jgi:YfiR/HmsC-like
VLGSVLSWPSRGGFYWLGAVVQGQVSREYDVKAVFLLNFAQFIDWPPEAFPDPEAPFVIGILGADPFRRTLEDVVRNETLRDRKVVVRRFQRVEDLGSCHILFISTSEERALPRIVTELKGRPILTVSEIEDFAQAGGMIRFYIPDAKVRFRINNEAARAAHLMISSKLLRLAEVVTPNPSPE